MTAFLLYGKFTSLFWEEICEDPEAAPRTVQKIAEQAGCTLEKFYFALEEFEFYAVLRGEVMLKIGMTRHQLMASGHFLEVHAEQLSTFSEMFPDGEAGV